MAPRSETLEASDRTTSDLGAIVTHSPETKAEGVAQIRRMRAPFRHGRFATVRTGGKTGRLERGSAGEVAAAPPRQFGEELGGCGMRIHRALGVVGWRRGSRAAVQLAPRAPVQQARVSANAPDFDRVAASRAALPVATVDGEAQAARWISGRIRIQVIV